MINERVEAKNYINGVGVSKHILYRICYLITKYNKESGMSQLECRNALFDWGAKNNIYIEYDVNSLISFVFNKDNKPLSDTKFVLFSKDDLYEINHRFDNRRVKLAAFALLAYAKRFANTRNEIVLSCAEISNWIGVSESAFRKTILSQLCDFEFVEIVKPVHSMLSKHNKILFNRTRIKMLIPVNNNGEYEVDDNIQENFNKLFR